MMQQRVHSRESGVWQQKYVECVAVLEEALDEARIEDVAVVNGRHKTGHRRGAGNPGTAGWVFPTGKIR
jgi:hypothetical protein